MSKSNYHHGDLKAALLEAAGKILSEEGLSKLSLRATARKAGVSQAAPYYHFPDKDTLLARVAEAGFLRLIATMQSYAERAPSAAHQLQQLGVGYVVFAVQNAAVFRLMQGPYFEDSNKYEFLQHAANQSYMSLREAVASHLPAANDKELDTACAAAWSLVHGAAVLCMDKRMTDVTDIDTVEDIEVLVQNITRQLKINTVLANKA